MSIEQPNSVDFIGTDGATGAVVLTISDHLDWIDEDEHLSLLQAKINAYLSFVESGELTESYPAAAGKSVRIEVVAQYPFSMNSLTFMRKAATVIEQAGLGLSWRQLEPKTGGHGT